MPRCLAPAKRGVPAEQATHRRTVALQLDETAIARLAFQEVWQRLALFVDEAHSIRSEVVADPSLFSEPWVNAQVRWVDVFQRELTALHAVHRAAELDVALDLASFRAAREAAATLREPVERVRDRTRDTRTEVLARGLEHAS